MERILLFPETPDINPSSFLSACELISGPPVAVAGYKLYSFIGCLDEIGHPFWAAAVPCAGRSALFFRFRAPPGAADPSALGLDSQRTPDGDVLFLCASRFNALCAAHGCAPVAGGDWGAAAPQHHRVAALAHLDVLGRSVRSSFSAHLSALDTLIGEVQRRYCVSVTAPLPGLYSEAHALLKLFGFVARGECADPSGANFFFGCLRRPVQRFLRRCFPRLLLGDCGLSPVVMKQLRALRRFVHFALMQFGHKCDDDITSLEGALHAYQLRCGLPQGDCSAEVLRTMLGRLLTAADPLQALAQVGVGARLSAHCEDECIGDIECAALSSVVAALPSPHRRCCAAQRAVVAAAGAAAAQFNGAMRDAEQLRAQLSGALGAAERARSDAAEAAHSAECALQAADRLAPLSDEIARGERALRARMKQNVQRRHVLLVMIAVALVVACARAHR